MDSNPIRIGHVAGSGRGFRARAGAAAAALLLTGSVIGWTAANGDTATSAAAAPSGAPAAAASRTLGGGVDSYSTLVDQIAPAVVTIRSERRVRAVGQRLPEGHPFEEFFSPFNRGPRAPERREGGLGSGVIVRNDGHILTNHHVVDGAQTVSVELHDGRSFKATVVGTDAPSDLAVLKIESANLPTLTLGDSEDVRVGDVVLAVGNPLGIGQTVTMGIVSAKGRATGAGDGSFEDFIQTDAPINRGNSGGALVSTRGELVGINSQILSPSGGSIGIGFAIPANMARNVMTQLIDGGTVRRGMLGVTVQPITSELAQSLGLTDVRGALVNSVEPDSAAAKAGVRRGDVILSVNGERVKDGNDLRNEVAQLLPGSKATLTIVREGREQQIEATLAELQANTRAGGSGSPGESSGFGLSVEPLTPERARQLGTRATAGIVVTAVDPSSRAAAAGLQPGDVIEEVDRRPVGSVDALRSALTSGDRPALLLVHRGASTLFLTLERR